MLIRLIGPVTITVDGVPTPMAAPKRACVLAALASQPGTPVSQTELIDRVWGADPPESVMSVLYSHVARLRAVLRSTSRAEITRAGAQGYALDVASEDVDLHAVRELAAEAGALRDSGRSREALQLWRRVCELADGEPLTGVGGRWAEQFRVAFRRERVGLFTERYAAELASGHHAAVVDELTALAADEPLAEALAGFESLRVRVRDELGADPSAELRRLHLQILDQDSELEFSPSDESSARPVVVERTVPAQLPADIASFTGREPELTALTDLLQEASRASPEGARASALATIVGHGGAGKTALASHWGHLRRGLFPDGQLYINLRGFDRAQAVPPKDALGHLLLALGQSGDSVPDNVDAAAEWYRTLTTDRRMLVVLDNVRDVEQVRPLLPGSGSFTIVTSRNRLTGLIALNDARSIRLDVLPPPESLELLSKLLGADRLTIEPEAAQRLTELCGRLPLALRIAAANLATNPTGGIAEYAAHLQNRDRLELLSIPDDPDAAVSATLDLSYDDLDHAAQQLFCRIGLIPGEDASLALVNEVSGLSEPETERALRQLLDGHLLEQHHRHRYRLHDLVRIYAVSRAEETLPETSRASVLDRFIEWHHDRAYGLTADEEANAFLACEALREHPKVWRLVLPLRNAINAGRFVERVRESIGIGLRQAERHGDAYGIFRMHTMSASAVRMEGDTATAISLGTRAVDLAEDLGARELTIAKGNLGVYLFDYGDYRAAERYLSEAVDLAAASENTRSQVIFVNSLIQVCTRLGAYQKASHYLAMVEALSDDWLTVTHRGQFKLYAAELLTALGKVDEALTEVDAASAIARQESDQYLESWSHSQRAKALIHAGRPELAREAIHHELAVARDRRMSAIEPEILCDYAAVLVDLGEHTEAIAQVTAARASWSTVPPYGEAHTALTLAGAYNGLGKHDVALGHAKRAVDMYAAMPWPVRHTEALRVLADAYTGLGDESRARDCLHKASRIAASAGMTDGE